MLEIARLDLSPRGARAARDAHALHRLLMQPFAADVGGRTGAGLLHRVESEDCVLVQYAEPADWSALGDHLAGVATKDAEAAHASIRDGDRLRFLLHANPTFDAVVDGRRRRSGLRDPDRQLDWIIRKLEQCGARPADSEGRSLLALGSTWTQRSKSANAHLTHRGVEYRGALVVVEADVLRRALRAGVGRGRAYGFGLLTVAP